MKKLITLVALAVLLASCSKKKEAEKKVTIPKVTVKELNATLQNEILKYSGTIEADVTVSLTFSVSGRISNIYVQEGQRVIKGQLLAAIDATNYNSSLDIAKAELEQSQDKFNRSSGLYEKRSLPERDFIVAKVSLTKAIANKNVARKNLNDTKLYAPFSGIITAKMTELGASASPQTPAFIIMKTDKVYAKASITESEISKLKIGTDANVEIASLNTVFKGKVAIVNPSADALTRTFNVKVRLDNVHNQLLPGMISTIQIKTENKVDVITIPSKAVLRDANDIMYVFVLQNNKAIKKRVLLGNFKGNEIIVTKGLKQGEKVIISGNKKLKDGQTVSL